MAGNMTWVHRLMAVLAVMLVAACGGPVPSRAPGQPAQEQPTGNSGARKVVTVAFAREATGIEVFGLGVTGRQNVMPLVHNLVVYEKDYQRWEPQLALDLPSVDKGTWRIDPDGTMEMTWKFHPNIVWHDGTPFSTEDIVFAVNVRKDPEMAATSAVAQGALELLDNVTAPDPLTLVTHWSATYVDADRARSIEPMPRHILQPLYERDKRSVGNSAFWNSEFVGLGPYKVANWVQGSHIDLARHDAYFLGRPKLDGVIVKFIPDDNTLVAAILAGAVDVATEQSDLSIDGARELERRWQGTRGNQVRYDANGALGNLQLQYREDDARPRNGFTNRNVRQALYQALDRTTLTQVLTDGISPVADSWYHPNHPLRREVESAIPQFPYDPNRAQQLLAQEGWVRGSDGVLVHQQSGERFESEVWAQGSDLVQWAVAIIADWKTVGTQMTVNSVPAALAGGAGREAQAKRPGPRVGAFSAETFTLYRAHSSTIPNESNRWTGANEGAYNNPRVDAIIDRISRTTNPAQKIQVHRELAQEMMGDVGLMPLWWSVTPVVMANGVKGVRVVTIGGTLSSFEWDKD